MRLKVNNQTPMWMIRKSSWRSNCNIQQQTLRKNETLRIKNTLNEETEENRDNPPENSSRMRKGSKYFSSNLQKTKTPINPNPQTLPKVHSFKWKEDYYYYYITLLPAYAPSNNGPNTLMLWPSQELPHHKTRFFEKITTFCLVWHFSLMCQSFKILDFFECVQQSKAFDGIYWKNQKNMKKREREREILLKWILD